MTTLNTYVIRGEVLESCHEAKSVIKDFNFNTLLTTQNEGDLTFPRSSIKVFQAMPFILSNAHVKFNLNQKNIAISCASHAGENQHLVILKKWIKNIDLKINKLLCGSHNPINLQSSNSLLLSGVLPNQLHNNCSGKHLGMISGCLARKIKIDNYVDYNHPYQKIIQNILEEFMGYKIKKKNIGIDGCSAPQYAFPLVNLADSMISLLRIKEKKNNYANAMNTLLNSILKYPLVIGGTDRFDSMVMQITKGRIFCKGGAEGILLFADLKKNIGGVIKIKDGNDRAIPPLAIKIFEKLSLISNNEIKKFSKWNNQILYNHANKKIGRIFSEIRL